MLAARQQAAMASSEDLLALLGGRLGSSPLMFGAEIFLGMLVAFPSTCLVLAHGLPEFFKKA